MSKEKKYVYVVCENSGYEGIQSTFYVFETKEDADERAELLNRHGFSSSWKTVKAEFKGA